MYYFFISVNVFIQLYRLHKYILHDIFRYAKLHKVLLSCIHFQGYTEGSTLPSKLGGKPRKRKTQDLGNRKEKKQDSQGRESDTRQK